MEANDKASVDRIGNVIKKISDKRIFIGIAIVAAVALLLGFGIYNSPDNRMSRQLDLGQKYLEEQNYEQAIVAFNEAIEIDDRCLEAYLGGMEAYAMLGDAENQKALYEKALGKVREFSAEEIEADKENVILLYLEAETVYAGDDEKILGILQEGYALTGDERLNNAIKKIEERIQEELVRQEQLEKEELWQFFQSNSILFSRMKELCSIRLAVNQPVVFTDEEIKELFKPYIDRMERFVKYYPEDMYGSSEALTNYYIVQGELEKALEIRQRTYNATGDKRYYLGETEREKFNGTINIYDEFGAWIYSNYEDNYYEYLYDEKHRIISQKGTFYRDYLPDCFQYEINYFYDSEGRTEKIEGYHWENGILDYRDIYYYDYTESGYTMTIKWIYYNQEGLLENEYVQMWDVKISIEYLDNDFKINYDETMIVDE